MIDYNIILNVFIAMFVYNIVLKAFGALLMQQFMKGEQVQKEKSKFRDRLKEKLEEK